MKGARMIPPRGLALSCLLVVHPLLGLQPSSKPKRFVNQVYTWGLRPLANLQDADRIQLIEGDTLSLFEPLRPAGKVTRQRLPGGLSATGPDMLKFRYGAWYCLSKRAIYRLDPTQNTWTEVVRPDRSFAQFEVGQEGTIILFSTLATVPDAPSFPREDFWPQFLVPKRMKALAEVWKPGAKEPSRVIEYPKDFMDTARRVRPLGGVRTTVHCGDRILAYHPETGRLWMLKLEGFSLKELAPPWTPLTPDLLDKAQWLPPEPDPGTVGYGTLEMECHSGGSVGFFPASPTTLHMAYFSHGLAEDQAKRADAEVRLEGGRLALLQPLEKVKRRTLHIAALDLTEGSFSKPWQAEPVLHPGQKSPFGPDHFDIDELWITPTGEVQDLRKLVTQLEVGAERTRIMEAEQRAKEGLPPQPNPPPPPPPPGGWSDFGRPLAEPATPPTSTPPQK